MELSITGQEAILSYLRQVKFKKRVIGGVDEEDALDKIEHVTGMYKDLVVDLQGQLEAMQQEIQRYEGYEAARTELVVRANREAEKIITQAKVQAEKLVEQKERETERQLAGRRAEIEQLAQQRKSMEVEMDNLVMQMKTTVRLIAGDLSQMLKLASELESKIGRTQTGNDAGGV